MKERKVIKRHVLIFFLLFVFFSAGGYLLNFSFEVAGTNHEKILKRLGEKISEKQNQLSYHLLQLKETLASRKAESLFERGEFHSLREQGFSFLVFRNDSLKFWSDNSIPCPAFFDETLCSRPVIKLGNGWYRVIKEKQGDHVLLGFYYLKSSFRYENDYLKNEFRDELNIRPGVLITDNRTDDAVFDDEGQYLFSLRFKNKIPLTGSQAVWIFLLYGCGLLFLIALLFKLHRWLWLYHKCRALFVGGFIFDLFLIRFLLFYFHFPGELYHTVLFSPLHFAAAAWLPSFGDLIVNVVLLLIAAWVFYRYAALDGTKKAEMHPALRLLTGGGIIIFFAFTFRFLMTLMRSMVIDSTIPYTLNNIFNLNTYSFVGFILIASLALSWSLVFYRALSMMISAEQRPRNFLFAGIFAALVLIIVELCSDFFGALTLAEYAVFLTGMWLFRERGESKKWLSRIVFSLFFFSLVSAVALYSANDFRETEKRKSLAQKLSNSQDPIAEFLYRKIESDLITDTNLQAIISKYPEKQEFISEYIQKTYFTGFWGKYKIQITPCESGDSLIIPPAFYKEHCFSFFEQRIAEFGKPTQSGNLYMLNFGTGGNSYISRLQFPIDTLRRLDLFIEMSSMFINKGLGYPELLIDKKVFLNTDLSNYSYARYRNNELSDAYGKFYYSIRRDPADTLGTEMGFFDRDGYNHLYYRTDKNAILIISKKQETFLEIAAPFSLLFLFFAFYMLLFMVAVKFPFGMRRTRLNFKNRLHVSMISVILISFILIGVSMLYYIRQLNENKNLEALSEKTLSIMIEVQAKLADRDSLEPEMEVMIGNYLRKFSNVFFSDINLYDLNGNLLSSSRPQIFEEGLLSYRMNTVAYNELVNKRKTIFIHKEKIGKLEFYSAYMPFHNYKNNLIAYLNLPYFARENELKSELSNFMMTFINVYVFLIGITTIIALFISGRITRPLKEIRDKIGKVQLGGKNEKIVWTRQDDEIGNLVNEYNRMIDELALSAELLAKSERESAWREMAKQVAHEIKNPLTPMKLSVQYLEKAWNDKAPDWDQRLKKFTKTLTEQIDSLSAIASAFSDFAKMPRSDMKIIDLVGAVNTSISTFPGELHFIALDYDKTQQYRVLADKKQIIRAINNLIINAVQAIGERAGGRIVIRILRGEEKYEVSVSDNGPGISDEQKSRIFTPNFSTKTEGMGLGLAIVKSIIEGHGGMIWFESRAGEGATFFFELPVPGE